MRSLLAIILNFGLIFAMSPVSAKTEWCATSSTGAEIDESKCFNSKKKCKKYIRNKNSYSLGWYCFPNYS
tara:strand:- start:90 stop:299 length:210 start_codon:yes stop_codon:yes gene_type:complete